MIIFINGLTNDLREFIALQQPHTLEQALEKARLYESVKTTKSKDPFKLAVAQFNEKNESSYELKTLRKQLAELQGEIKELKGQNKKLSTLRKETLNKTKTKISKFANNTKKFFEATTMSFIKMKRSRENRKSLRCWFCRIRGHIKKKCTLWIEKHDDIKKQN